MSKRAGSLGDRDRYVEKHTPARGVEVPEEVTGQYEGEQLAYFRGKRPTHERLDRLETKADAAASDAGEMKAAISGMSAKLDTFLDFIKADRIAEHQTNQLSISTRGKVVIGIATALATALAAAITAGMAGCL
jgi:hypothetical protein